MIDFHKLIDPSRWFAAFPEPPGPLYLVLVAFFVVWTIVAMVLYLFRGRIFARQPALKGMATRFGWYAVSIGWIGLFFLAVRYAQIPYFDMRIFLFLTILLALFFVGFVIYYLRVRYPKRVAEIRAHERRQKYAPEPKRRRAR